MRKLLFAMALLVYQLPLVAQKTATVQYMAPDSLFTLSYPAHWSFEEKQTGEVVFPQQVVFTNPKIKAARLTIDVSVPGYIESRGGERFWSSKFNRLTTQQWKPEWAEYNGLKAVTYKKTEVRPEGRTTICLWLVGNDRLYLRISYAFSSFAAEVVASEIETINEMLNTLVIL